MDRDYLERLVTLEDIKEAIWDCGSSKAPGPDGFSFAFVKKYWDIIRKDIWKYLDHILDSLGFGYTWRSWIKSCLSSSRASILVNGSPTSEFFINRGLRQGDPLASFLFILVMKGLRNTFTEAMMGNIDSRWNARDLEKIIRVLHVFYLTSGLKINILKSNIYGIGVNAEEVYNMASNAGCTVGNIPFNYLGLPIGSNMKSTASWKVLVDRFRSRLSTWKANLLSIRGRLTLIKSVLGSLGLNIGSLKAFNLALSQKWRWRMFSSPNDLWVKVVKAFHGHESGFDNNRCSFKGIWANIVGSSNFLHSKGIILSNSFHFKAGCGTRIRFWKDIWVGEAPFFIKYNRLYRLDQDKDCLIIDRIINGQWHWNWSRTNLGARNLSSFRDMLNEIGQVNIEVSEDTCVWSLGPKGTFTVKDARNLIDQKSLPSLPSTTWEKSIPRKVNIFIWRLSLDRLPHRLNLSLRGMDILTISCSSCNANVESANHIFFECTIASDMWKLVYRWCDIPFVQALSFEAFKDWFSSWHAPKDKKHKLYVISAGSLVALEIPK
ncbi:RNA-directed DNA polymerase, eukaryota, reverse transcriptase zinc-binding domain protein [Tanacetum coccineum]